VREADNLTTFMCECHEIWEPKPRGTLWATPGLLRDSFLLLLLSVGLPVANAPDVLQPCGLLYYP